MTDPLGQQPPEVLDELCATICQDFARAVPRAEIVASLVKSGWTADEAELAVHRAEDIFRLDVEQRYAEKYARLDRERRAAARIQLVAGALILAFGIATTVGSYVMAGPGGVYVFTYGAITVGGTMFAVGVADFRAGLRRRQPR